MTTQWINWLINNSTDSWGIYELHNLYLSFKIYMVILVATSKDKLSSKSLRTIALELQLLALKRIPKVDCKLSYK